MLCVRLEIRGGENAQHTPKASECLYRWCKGADYTLEWGGKSPQTPPLGARGTITP